MKSFKEYISEASGDKKAYQKFFAKALKKFGVSSPSELEGDKEKEFYDYVDANWEGDNETDEAVEVDGRTKGYKKAVARLAARLAKKKTEECDDEDDEDEDDVDEAKIKKVVRGNKIVKKTQCKPGYKADGKRCVKMKAKEKINKKKAAKKMVRSKKGKSKNAANRKRNKSMRKSNRLSK